MKSALTTALPVIIAHCPAASGEVPRILQSVQTKAANSSSCGNDSDTSVQTRRATSALIAVRH